VGFTLTKFHNGKVLAVGGFSGTISLSSAEIYDPSKGVWSRTGSMNIARFYHTATLLPDGKVLVAGGFYNDGSCSDRLCSAVATAELYDPSTGTWSLTGSMNVARENHTATLLSNGEVLVAGGDNGGGGPNLKALPSAELYNLATSTWTLTGTMHAARFNHSATILGNGEVLVAGGDDGAGYCCLVNSSLSRSSSSYTPNSPMGVPHGIASAELYNPATGKWSRTGRLHNARTSFTATSIPDGTFRVLVAGGEQCNTVSGSCKTYSSAEIYDPATGVWTLTGSMHSARSGHAAAQLNPGTGQVLVSGGCRCASAEVFTVSTGTWSLTGKMNSARFSHSSLRLNSGQVLVAGGTGKVDLSTAELFTP
jgi:N-acetylneuraminic acid mutarotase